MAITSPGVQKPHWTAPSETMACWTSERPVVASASTPSMVTMSAPTADAPSTRQLHRSSPSSSTEQEPHSPCSQAFLEPGRPRRSRSTNRRLSPSHPSATSWSWPLTRSR